MNNKEPTSEIERAPLRDVTDQVIEDLGKLAEKRKPYIIEPRGYYIQAPGAQGRLDYFVDKGCRGGWNDHSDFTLDDQTYPIASVEGAPWGGTITLQPIEDRHGKPSVKLDSLESMNFYKEDRPQQQSVNNVIDALLQSKELVTLKDIAAEIPDGKMLSVSSADPFKYPLVSELRDTKTAIEDAPVASLSAITSAGRAMVFFSFLSFGTYGHEHSWTPLDQLSFGLKEQDPVKSDREQIAQNLGYLVVASRLQLEVDDTNVLDQVNTRIRRAKKQLYYSPNSNGGYDNPYIAAHIDGTGTPVHAQAMTTKYPNGNPFLQLDAIQKVDRAYWVIDKTNKVAAPLVHDHITDSASRYSHENQAIHMLMNVDR